MYAFTKRKKKYTEVLLVVPTALQGAYIKVIST